MGLMKNNAGEFRLAKTLQGNIRFLNGKESVECVCHSEPDSSSDQPDQGNEKVNVQPGVSADGTETTVKGRRISRVRFSDDVKTLYAQDIYEEEEVQSQDVPDNENNVTKAGTNKSEPKSRRTASVTPPKLLHAVAKPQRKVSAPAFVGNPHSLSPPLAPKKLNDLPEEGRRKVSENLHTKPKPIGEHGPSRKSSDSKIHTTTHGPNRKTSDSKINPAKGTSKGSTKNGAEKTSAEETVSNHFDSIVIKSPVLTPRKSHKQSTDSVECSSPCSVSSEDSSASSASDIPRLCHLIKRDQFDVDTYHPSQGDINFIEAALSSSPARAGIIRK